MDLPPVDSNVVALYQQSAMKQPQLPVMLHRRERAVPVTEQCISRVSDEFRIPGFILKAVMLVEGGKPGTISENKNGSFDIGVMQINTSNVGTFIDMGVSVEELQWNGCTSLAAAGYLLRGHYDEAERDNRLNNWDDFLEVTARYNSKTPKHNIRYQGRLIKAINSLSEETM